LLHSDEAVTVVNDSELLRFLPKSPRKAGLIFLCGSGVAGKAYAPLLKPVADAGYPVFIIKLPYRFAPFESHKLTAIDRVQRVISDHKEISEWILSGHSLGGALACRIARDNPKTLSALVLIGTTHPRHDDLTWLEFPVTKVYASNDGIAPFEKINANRRLLPKHTTWILIDGGNHSQFGNYGRQLLDGSASISRSDQQDITRTAILDLLEAFGE
jgi:pimeloyl-ACP methyl ester carboxylesterase